MVFVDSHAPGQAAQALGEHCRGTAMEQAKWLSRPFIHRHTRDQVIVANLQVLDAKMRIDGVFQERRQTIEVKFFLPHSHVVIIGEYKMHWQVKMELSPAQIFV
jgi:hypothetical protein